MGALMSVRAYLSGRSKSQRLTVPVEDRDLVLLTTMLSFHLMSRGTRNMMLFRFSLSSQLNVAEPMRLSFNDPPCWGQ